MGMSELLLLLLLLLRCCKIVVVVVIGYAGGVSRLSSQAVFVAGDGLLFLVWYNRSTRLFLQPTSQLQAIQTKGKHNRILTS